MKNPKSPVPSKVEGKIKSLNILEQELKIAQEREKRAVADYQNLLRRQQQERLEIIKFAVGELVTDLVQPLDHLSLAAKQINDQGLNMVINQLWEVLQKHGLTEISPQIGEEFNLEFMTAAEESKAGGEKVASLISKGYKLNNKVIKHAKVIVN